MEELLHYTWKHKLFPLRTLHTVDGRVVEVIDPGLHNPDAGPDFFNAKLTIDGMVWAGNVELHVRASDWYLHHHDQDERYDSVILHVVEESDTLVQRRSGEAIPQLVLPVPPSLTEGYRELLSTDHYPPCHRCIPSLPALKVHGWLSALLCERLENRCAQIMARYEQHDMNWNDALLCTLAHNLGFGVNGEAFDALFRNLSFRIIDKHRDNLLQVEALLFGQAGLLDIQALPAYCREEAQADPYMKALRHEYAHLSHKFSLHPMAWSMWKFARMRPDNSPFIRVAQLAMIAHRGLFTSAALTASPNREGIDAMLRTGTSEYWDTHYCFGSVPTQCRKKVLGNSALTLILINTVAPFLFAMGRRHGDENCCSKAILLLEQLPAENNYITRGWQGCGLAVSHAADSQALIQLKRCYCERHDCLRCRFGYEFLHRLPL